MKVISIHNHWASLIANGVKTMEVRSRAPEYRGPILLHAAKKISTKHPLDIYRCTSLEPLLVDGRQPLHTVPGGHIFARANLAHVVPLTTPGLWKATCHMHRINKPYEKPMFGWILTDIELTELVPAKGQQSFWKHEDVPTLRGVI